MHWRLRENGAVEGVIYDSFDKTYPEGSKMIFLNTRLTHYKYAEGYWPDHFVASTHTGEHFMMIDKDRINEPSMA